MFINFVKLVINNQIHLQIHVDITPDIWFQQDTAHTSVIARDWLKSRFGSKVISHRRLHMAGQGP